ncbi:hypothetical protein HL653_08905 [Sphingomonas sp. AP4-R1]|nr:hypothetical protein [Sphingomonas sp. AP4-R1]QJU56364.1 hypothetical protein HL653_08905 [Sphingomonas sp. AP4-R1]
MKLLPVRSTISRCGSALPIRPSMEIALATPVSSMPVITKLSGRPVQ